MKIFIHEMITPEAPTAKTAFLAERFGEVELPQSVEGLGSHETRLMADGENQESFHEEVENLFLGQSVLDTAGELLGEKSADRSTPRGEESVGEESLVGGERIMDDGDGEEPIDEEWPRSQYDRLLEKAKEDMLAEEERLADEGRFPY